VKIIEKKNTNNTKNKIYRHVKKDIKLIVKAIFICPKMGTFICLLFCKNFIRLMIKLSQDLQEGEKKPKNMKVLV
jgi:hypothetical protein